MVLVGIAGIITCESIETGMPGKMGAAFEVSDCHAVERKADVAWGSEESSV